MKFKYLKIILIILLIPVSTGLLMTVGVSKPTDQSITSELIYSSFLGSSNTDACHDIVIDSYNNIYLSGCTHSSDFPTTLNAYDESYNGGSDVFVSKISADGSEIIFSTFLGGSGDDYGDYDVKYTAITLDSENNIYLLGTTRSSDFPTTSNAYDQDHNGEQDIFIAKISANGSKLLYSTYLGGISNEMSLKLVLDNANNAIIAGRTISPDFPLVNPYDSARSGYEGFVAKLSADGSELLYSSFIGGESYDEVWALTVDNENCIYIGGTTGSSDFPIVNAYDSTYAGGQDAYVAKLSANGSELLYSTFLGGSGEENLGGITLDGSNNAYVTGWTGSSNFPVVNAYDSTYGGGLGDIFLVKLSPDGSEADYATYLGGSGDEIGLKIVLDDSYNVFFSGTTSSSNFPMVNAYNATYGGGEIQYGNGLEVGDGIMGIMSSDGSELLYSTFLGGSGVDGCQSIKLDGDYNAYLVGLTSSSNFPISSNVLDTTFNGDFDAFISKFKITGIIPTSTTTTTTSIPNTTTTPTSTVLQTTEDTTSTTTTAIGFDLITVFVFSVTFGIPVLLTKRKTP